MSLRQPEGRLHTWETFLLSHWRIYLCPLLLSRTCWPNWQGGGPFQFTQALSSTWQTRLFNCFFFWKQGRGHGWGWAFLLLAPEARDQLTYSASDSGTCTNKWMSFSWFSVWQLAESGILFHSGAHTGPGNWKTGLKFPETRKVRAEPHPQVCRLQRLTFDIQGLSFSPVKWQGTK